MLLKKHFKDVKSFQQHQQITMYIIMQFSMFLAIYSQSRGEIMDFYEDAYKSAVKKIGRIIISYQSHTAYERF